ncbi:hypothetical protein HDV00_007919 [Rhizophlyctis rosea]|nr:hypothetical protein HDV00_007919 [Rhizophlyctis rosea]
MQSERKGSTPGIHASDERADRKLSFQDEERGQGGDIAIGELAAGAKAAKPIAWYNRVSVPLGVMTASILVVNVLSVVLPMGLIMRQSANTGMSSLSADLIMNSARFSASQISLMLDQPKIAVESTMRNKDVRDWIMNVDDYTKNPIAVSEVYLITKNLPFITNIVFTTYPNITGELSPDGLISPISHVYNTTTAMVMGANAPMYGYLDYVHGPIGMFTNLLDPTTGVPFNSSSPYYNETLFIPAAYLAGLYKAETDGFMTSDPPRTEGYWNTIQYPLKGYGAGIQYNRVYSENGQKLYRASSLMYTAHTLATVLQTLKPTANAVTMLVESTGVMIASSDPDASANLTTRYNFTGSVNPVVSGVGQMLLGEFKTVDHIPDEYLTQTEIVGKQYFVSSKIISMEPMSMALVIAIPRSDFFSQIDSGQQKGTITSAVVAVCVTTIGVILITLIVRPLHTLTTAMTEITKFDFSVLKSGILNHRSLVTEIRTMESVFDTMCKAL